MPGSEIKTKIKNEEDRAKLTIPTWEDLETMYEPLGNLLMILPLPNITSVKGLILPDAHQVVLNEGHIVAKGDQCTDAVGIGDCVVWNKHSETRWKTQREFVTVNEPNIVMRIPLSTLQAQAELQAG